MSSRSRRSFTLIELLVVVAIIGLLSAIALTSVSTASAKARDVRRIGDLNQFSKTLDLYLNTNGVYPIWASGGCTSDPYNPLITALINSTYLSSLPTDPNSSKYCYYYISDSTGINYKLAVYLERDTASASSDNGTASSYYEIYKSAGAQTSQISLTNTTLNQIMTNQQQYQDTSIVGDWHFNEGSGTDANDSSAYANNGQLCDASTCPAAGPTWQTSNCISGNCLSFNGTSNYVKVNPVNPPEYVSVIGWFKRLGVPASGYHIIFMQGTQIENSVPDSGGQIRTGVTTNTMSRQVFNSGSGLTDGNWHFLSFTYNGSKLTAYIDASQTTQQNVSGSLITGSSTNIGTYSGGYYSNGLEDEVRVYKRALQSCEVCALCRRYQSKAFCSNCTNCSGD
ncbi:MAG: prepilin-type N-terminal cleavage/methylation domain-containing protein [Patescibacteria group bacterium]|nr:prepilin-type N-terminal cleavage/methylation domain-containing protein [Patescibacteria group bacterium]MDD5121475.1 prepilin-type N-terminal cleavage/methylation domain-containing protein [Patescibacteria group bacterium]MDD5221947.1 prepilin-type N-terminal cleavage/methylation domain-containing protein [Patescibacteria group bacterium]MDD5396363.1 prepilin-type N-terminal cleavage/methylation domain-containing protein [Patescibacteria group bacterium]